MKRHLVVVLAALSLTGCLQAVAYIPSLIQAGAGAVAGMENVDVKAAVSPGVTQAELQKVKRIAVVLEDDSTKQPYAMTSGSLTKIMSDNIALELMNLGYQVIERNSLDKVLSEQGLQMSGAIDTATMAKVGKVLGIDAVVLGNITASQSTKVNSGFMGAGAGVATSQIISNATMKVVGIEQGNVIMMVTLSYKKGQNPAEASKTMAVALAEKLNPKEKKGNRVASANRDE